MDFEKAGIRCLSPDTRTPHDTVRFDDQEYPCQMGRKLFNEDKSWFIREFIKNNKERMIYHDWLEHKKGRSLEYAVAWYITIETYIRATATMKIEIIDESLKTVGTRDDIRILEDNCHRIDPYSATIFNMKAYLRSKTQTFIKPHTFDHTHQTQIINSVINRTVIAHQFNT